MHSAWLKTFVSYIEDDSSPYKALTDRVGGAGGRAQKVCVPLRRCTPPGHEGDNGSD